MRRRAAIAATLGLALLPARLVCAQTSATTLQIDLVMARASLAALGTRYGAQHPEITGAEARLASLRTSLTQARARHEVIDVAAVTSRVESELADTRARLAEFGTRCGAGHLDVATARAREQALVLALEHLTSDGYYLGE